MDSLRYPIGQFAAVENPTEEQREQFIESIAKIPDKLQQAVDGLGAEQLNTSYHVYEACGLCSFQRTRLLRFCVTKNPLPLHQTHVSLKHPRSLFVLPPKAVHSFLHYIIQIFHFGLHWHC
ncbi:hypothetical protein MUG84_00050 [Paenibacillus sp. KQZ6P-2]|uniref:Uncharacterized protein n=1 Tax=Paenibacillus mangrovi TaxID=2931978 RepID=A0A9X1WJY9_9BACL|nr:hypothetical protein [Paenibacillus mangrovi]MCJ8010131.1 hypothetical protein [Paenibacillus mangrovi]